ncbi:MAG: histidine phosphatase family protein [Polyangiaceae bacterium]|nr:histidine phosphatase family protein [Polyangiaceae bacterium]MBK8997650.1 histidine phosphatase family protein [Myxococcales bacterium]MCE7895018.1 histidine phosphatase family protein [Sorangiineae bacterium PRO1]MCL4754101.1 phosphoglycerate mutase family protein [Myxococcales bacterium]
MDLLLVRHGESEANAEGRLQGSLDYPLSERGRAQAGQLARWLDKNGVGWDFAFCSPLLRAKQTAEILCAIDGRPAASIEPDLAELRAGALEGLTREDMQEKHPEWMKRSVTQLGDFSEFGGESYDQVQERATRLIERWTRDYRAANARLLVVAHGGINFQLLKRLICLPVPRVAIVRMGNCSVTQVKLRERRGTFMGELVFHLPIEMMGMVESADTGALFR